VDWVHVANWGTAAAAHLYQAVGFEQYTTQVAWRRVLGRA
jgi:hypothetical protein